MGLAFIAGLSASITLGLGLHLFTNAIPKLARILIGRAARRLPVSMKQTQEAAWLADLANLETHFEILSCAVACWITSFRMRPPFVAEETLRELNTARTLLRTHGAVASFAINRIKSRDTAKDPTKWTWSERWCVAIIFASKAPIERYMREYFLALERDVRERPRHYGSKEEATKEFFVPIQREINIFKFFREYESGKNGQ